MSTDTKTILDSLEDLIFNQDKIVTYKWLSRTFNTHTNTSKQLLYMFCLNFNEKLSVTYLICGSTEEGDEVLVVPECEVDKVKSSLNSLLSQHVYSVQKASSTHTSSDLYLADSTACSSENMSSIMSRQVETRELKMVSPQQSSVEVKNQTCSKPQQKPGPVASAKPGIFASKAADKIEKQISVISTKEKQVSPVKSKVLSPSRISKKKGAQVKCGNIGALLVKQAEKKRNEPQPMNTEPEVKKPTEQIAENAAMEVDEGGFIPDAVLENNSPLNTVQKTPVSQRTLNGRKKRKKINRAVGSTGKKRRRIVLASDSESEEEEDVYVEEEPEVIDPPAPATLSDSEEDEVIPPTPLGEMAKRRVRKQIDNVFVDEDGFVNTTKEFVHVSCSEDEATNQDETVESKREYPTSNGKRPVLKDKTVQNKKQGWTSENVEKEENQHQKQGEKNKRGPKKAKSPKKQSPQMSNKQQLLIMSFFPKR